MYSIENLIKGFRDFRSGMIQKQDATTKQTLENQAPRILMIACCDSRVDPAIITNAHLGEILMIRNVANLVPPYRTDSHYQSTASAIEFAVDKLKVRHIVIMGHSRCGGIMTVLGDVSQETATNHPLGEWMSVMEDVAIDTLKRYPDESLESQACKCGRSALGVSLNNLKTYPWVQDALARNAIYLHGWYFNLADIDIEALDPETGKFHSLSQA